MKQTTKLSLFPILLAALCSCTEDTHFSIKEESNQNQAINSAPPGSIEKEEVNSEAKPSNQNQPSKSVEIPDDPKKQFQLAEDYLATQKIPEAIALYQRAAQEEYHEAQAKLGTLYAAGIGVEQDSSKAEKWLLAAATKGNAKAQIQLGEMYYKGKGIKKNLVNAYCWFDIAEANGLKMELKHLITISMTPHQVQEAHELSHQLRTKFPDMVKAE